MIQTIYVHRRANKAGKRHALANKFLRVVEKKLSATRKEKRADVILAGPTKDGNAE